LASSFAARTAGSGQVQLKACVLPINRSSPRAAGFLLRPFCTATYLYSAIIRFHAGNFHAGKTAAAGLSAVY
jgi:hypothetical protein